eukprot:TRINITY_DN55155_c0_g1_i1.p1 TRINITY_DN55155_c0_g1~~TRINITY_DN55155_c0_g1_i1.p1  ORF type:complete len:372 (+),score=47.49 TRINITY_DN55155_c0_g1_i1:65-1180(+)
MPVFPCASPGNSVFTHHSRDFVFDDGDGVGVGEACGGVINDKSVHSASFGAFAAGRGGFFPGRKRRPAAVVSSFFLDCSVAAGVPENLSPTVFCHNGQKCRSYHDECGRLRRVMRSKRMVPSLNSCLHGEPFFVHVLDGDNFLKCCMKGDPGDEHATCAFMTPKFPKPQMPLPLAKPLPKGKLQAMKWASKRTAALIKQNLPDLLGEECGSTKCGSSGEFPTPVCLTPVRTNLSDGVKSTCLHFGRSGMLYPRDSVLAPHQHKVFQLAVPPPSLLFPHVRELVGTTASAPTAAIVVSAAKETAAAVSGGSPSPWLVSPAASRWLVCQIKLDSTTESMWRPGGCEQNAVGTTTSRGDLDTRDQQTLAAKEFL